MIQIKRALWAFSGLDGAGKTTQIELLMAELGCHKKAARRIWIRIGYTPLLDWIRKVIRRSHPELLPPPGQSIERDKAMRSSLVRRGWLVLSMLDLLIYVGIWVRFLRVCGCNIILDRFIEDSELDLQLNFENDKADKWLLWRFVKYFMPKPQVHFLFLVPIDESLKRSRQKKEPFPDTQSTLEKRLAAYENYLSKKQMVYMDGLETQEVLHMKVQQHCRMRVCE